MSGVLKLQDTVTMYSRHRISVTLACYLPPVTNPYTNLIAVETIEFWQEGSWILIQVLKHDKDKDARTLAIPKS